tara:strand:+ start:627 stop:815 length:189 start_codon:yes stop_codon:yes gene_type:complete
MSTLPYINEFFDWCVLAITWFGDVTGMGYNLANIFLFVFLQPFLIILFFCLWIKSYRRGLLQ